jgi:NADPH-dependent 2,4-dienoyl-CoA reductase/sulfur reductase-like enzyme
MISEELECDFLIVGGGPAGLAAGAFAARHGVRTLLVDERVTLGGQIYKQPGPGFVIDAPQKLGPDFQRGVELIEDARTAGVQFFLNSSVVTIRHLTAVIYTHGASSLTIIHAKRLLICPGAHDRPVAFPGWTLPGVITAGGAQSLFKTSRVSVGDRVAFVGSGPVALAFPAQLRHYGVNVILALEAGPPPSFRAALAMLKAGRGNASLLRDGIRYRGQLLRARVPLRYRRIIVRAEGVDHVEAVIHAAVDREWRVLPGTEERVEVDTICVGYGFVPSSELFRLIECRFRYDEDLGGAVVVLDEWGQTTVPGVFGAGDGTGVRGSLVATAQGCLAALRVVMEIGSVDSTEAESLAQSLRRRLMQKEIFRGKLQTMFAVGPGIFELASADTIICRCEEVSRQRLDEAIMATSDLNTVKSYTRAGMGLCQGRNCLRQIQSMVAAATGTTMDNVGTSTQRPPVRHVPLSALADESIRDRGLFTRE